jgi:outer membrane lipopolysaccharide assembly protein LptE/RlpB
MRMRSTAIRAEWPGGNELLDARQKLFELRKAAEHHQLPGNFFVTLDEQEKLLNRMYEAAAAAIIAKYASLEQPDAERSESAEE